MLAFRLEFTGFSASVGVAIRTLKEAVTLC